MRISDWSSDVCSSDLTDRAAALRAQLIGRCHEARIRRQPGSHAIGAEQQQIGLGIGAALRAVRAIECAPIAGRDRQRAAAFHQIFEARSEEHTSELQSLMRISYAGFCLKKNKNKKQTTQ